MIPILLSISLSLLKFQTKTCTNSTLDLNLICKFTMSVCDGARVHHRRPTEFGPALLDSRISIDRARRGVLGQVHHRRPAGSLVPCTGGMSTAVLWFPVRAMRARSFSGFQHGRSVAWRRSAALLQAREEEEDIGEKRREERGLEEECCAAAGERRGGG